MNRADLASAVRPFAPGGKLTEAMIGPLDALADALGLPRTEAGTSDIDPQLIEDLKRDEGLRLKAYKDTVGVYTIGYGHAHVPPGTVWTQKQAEDALVEDVRKHNAELSKALPWTDHLDPVRRRVLQNLTFNIGIGSRETGKGLLGFQNTLAAIQRGDYAAGANGLAASQWYRQVGDRAKRLVKQMREG